VFNLKVDLF